MNEARCRISAVQDEVHVYRIDLTRRDGDSFRNVLSADEVRRARSYFFERDRRRFIAGREALRQVLSGYIGCSPQDVSFDYDIAGKPFLRGCGALQFSLSRSADVCLIAVCRGSQLGVDVELMSEIADIKLVVDRFFAPGERAALEALPARERLTEFYRCWTRKEAFVKAIGRGIGGGLDTFEVEVRRDAPARLLRVGDDSLNEPTRWTLLDLGAALDGGYAAALAIRSKVRKVRCIGPI